MQASTENQVVKRTFIMEVFSARCLYLCRTLGVSEVFVAI